jgi:hypothetical protein
MDTVEAGMQDECRFNVGSVQLQCSFHAGSVQVVSDSFCLVLPVNWRILGLVWAQAANEKRKWRIRGDFFVNAGTEPRRGVTGERREAV